MDSGLKCRSKWTLCIALGWLCAVPVAALDTDASDPREIIQAVENRDDGDKRKWRMTLTVTDSGGRSLRRTIVGRSLDFEGGTRTLMLFEAPADVRNTGLLSVDHGAADKSDDQWLYLPSLHRSMRISAGEKPGSFLGTDLSYTDMTSKSADNYDYDLLAQSEKVDGEDCWVVQARPQTDKEKKETGYLKSHIWVSKSKLVAVQLKHWIAEGRKLKYMKFTHFKQFDGVWIAERLTVRVVRGGKVESTTTLVSSDILINQPDVTDADFYQRRLEQGLYPGG